MKFIPLYRVEFTRLALSKSLWVIAALCLCAPLLGYSVITASMSEVMSGKYIANPVLAGTTVGAILWAVFTIAESDRLHCTGTDVITGSIASPLRLCAARTAAILSLSVITVLLCALLYLPYTAGKMEYLFSLGFYMGNFFAFMMPTWCSSILFAEAFYQISRRVEIAAVLYAALCYFSLSKFAEEDYFLRWINPLVVTYSDGFPSIWPLRVGVYTRVIWLLIATGIWLFALLCVRKYQKNLVLSFIRGIRKLYISIFSVVFIASGALLWIRQPFVDHGPEEAVDLEAMAEDETMEEREIIKADSIKHFLVMEPVTGRLSGKSEYNYSHYEKGGKRRMMLNTGYEVTAVTYAGKALSFKLPDEIIDGEQPIEFTLPKGKGGVLTIEFEGLPSMARFLYPYMLYDSIDKEYISLSNAATAPADLEVTGSSTVSITMPKHLTPFLNYQPMHDFVDNKDGTRTWTAESDLECPMSIRAADYKTMSFSVGDMGIDFVYGKKYDKTVKDNNVKQAITDVFNYCIKHYGKTDYAGGKRLQLQQISAMVMGGHAFEGHCEWFETVLSPETLSDPKKGANATEVFIHEMVHQWWGSYGLECKEEELWSSEGLAVYSTYRIAKEKYGELYAKKYYIDVWQEEVDRQDREFYYRHPEYLKKLPEKYQSNLNEQNQGTNWYCRMPLMIKKAEELVGGEEKMDKILRTIYGKHAEYDPYSNPFTYQDFLDACNLTEEDLYLE